MQRAPGVRARGLPRPQPPGLPDPQALALSGLAALLLPILPYAAEMVALRDLPAPVFGTPMSLEPAVGALVGFVLLAEQPSWVQALGSALVTTAGMGAVCSGARQPTARPRAESAGPACEPSRKTVGLSDPPRA
ncbi:EamA family transporter [Streptomyces sp. NPDC102406]|uniref:EamA family transporter n=1 Tax=Streptomyces sp. NPDC102406 TaxID=3366171 RepID=UPI0038237B82